MKISVFDVCGRLVDEINNGHFDAGRHETFWNAWAVPAGVYIVRLESPDRISTRKIELVK